MRFEGARGWEAAAAAADAADEEERLREQEQQQQAPNDGAIAAVPPPPPAEAPPALVPAPEPPEFVNIAVPDAHALLQMDEAQIQEVMNNIPEEAAEQLIIDLLAAAGIEDGLPANPQPGWRVPGLAQRAPGRPRQQRLPRLGGGVQFARPAGGDRNARRMNDGRAAVRGVAALGQQNYLRHVRGQDWIGEPRLENLGGEANHGIDEIGGDGLAEPEVPVEEPPAFVMVPPRGRNGRGRERGRGR